MLNNQRIICCRKHTLATYVWITHNFVLGAE